ncbi:MAG TPA: hypothetical protein VIL52_07150, partial [Bacteroidota bacterium]
TDQETRFTMLKKSDPEKARELMQLAQEDVTARWHMYEQLEQIFNPMNGNGSHLKKQENGSVSQAAKPPKAVTQEDKP